MFPCYAQNVHANKVYTSVTITQDPERDPQNYVFVLHNGIYVK